MLKLPKGPVVVDPSPIFGKYFMSVPGLIMLSPRITKLMPSMAVLIKGLIAPKTLAKTVIKISAMSPITLNASPIDLPIKGAINFTTSQNAANSSLLFITAVLTLSNTFLMPSITGVNVAFNVVPTSLTILPNPSLSVRLNAAENACIAGNAFSLINPKSLSRIGKRAVPTVS